MEAQPTTDHDIATTKSFLIIAWRLSGQRNIPLKCRAWLMMSVAYDERGLR